MANRGSDTLTHFPCVLFPYRWCCILPPLFLLVESERGREAGKIDSRLREKLLTPLSPLASIWHYFRVVLGACKPSPGFDNGRICVIFQCCSISLLLPAGYLPAGTWAGIGARTCEIIFYCILRSEVRLYYLLRFLFRDFYGFIVYLEDPPTPLSCAWGEEREYTRPCGDGRP